MSCFCNVTLSTVLEFDGFRWGKETNDSPETHVSHNVTNFEFLYEPFYVASDLVPIHDERFMGYGFTRNSQVSGFAFQFYFMSTVVGRMWVSYINLFWSVCC